MYLQIAFGIVFSAIEWNTIVSQALSPGVLTIALLAAGSILGLMVLLIWLTARRRQNWARWAILILVLILLPQFVKSLGPLLKEDPFAWGPRVIQFGIEIVALVLIFTGDAREWFKSGSDSMVGANPRSPIRPQP